MSAERILLPAHDLWQPTPHGTTNYYEKGCIGHGVLQGEMPAPADSDFQGMLDVYQCEQCRQLVPVERTRT